MYIYKATNTINGKVYIGKTIKSIDYRWKQASRWKKTIGEFAHGIH